MAIEQQASGKAGPAAPADTPGLSPKGAARRRLAGAGVIMTVASQPGMAAMVCTSPSGSLSGGLQSQAPSTTLRCAGLSPGYWKQSQHSWAGTGLARETPFDEIFPSRNRATTYGQATLQQILEGTNFDQNNLGMHLVATYLNVKSNRISFLDEITLRNMWTAWSNTGFYSPGPNASAWNGAAIVSYLKSTMD